MMPLPVLAIFKIRRSFFVYNVTLMFPLSGVYLKALDMRFPAILLKQLRSVFHVSSGAMSRQ